MKIKTLLIPFLMLVAGTASAELSSGYYKIKSNAYEGRYMGENCSSHQLYTTTSNSASNYALVWYIDVSGSSVTLKNALTDRYIQQQGTFSEYYSTDTSSASFTISESSPYTFADYSDAGLHCSASQSYNVVHWSTNSDNAASFWLLEPASVDETELNSQKAAFASADASALTTYFTSTACTALNGYYAGMNDSDLRSAMSSLPASVQELAVKVKNDDWTTYSGWSKTEKTFRIADYKAYSSHTRWTSILGFGYSLGRLSNPTGIWVDEGDIIQVYVGTIPSGQSVSLEVAGYGQSSGQQYPLHEGMNPLQITGSGNCFVFYEVDNTDSGSTPYTALSSYADVTVHIEGGTVQGYFDLTKGDTDDDWTCFKTHLMSEDMFCLKTKTLVFNLQTTALKHAVDEAEGGSTGEVVGMLNYWQRIQDMEDALFNRASIGGEDYAYCNNVHSVTTVGNSGDGSLYASSYGIYFSPEQHDRLFNYDLFRLGGDNLWASAHELGHHRQTPINMVGNTEMSNNLYSNVAVYQQGRLSSRTANIKDVFSNYIDGISWPERIRLANNSIGNYNAHILHLNWSLYLFFHVLGNDTNFFPRLFNALRTDPMTRVSGSGTLTPASTDYLKYYVKCCQVSGYDLTDFFASYGFFMLPPEQASDITYNGVTTNRYQSFKDYADYNLYVTQEMINAAKAEVAAMSGLKAGSGVVFIEDRVEAPEATYDGAATGTKRTINPDAPVKAFGDVGEMGQYTSFGVTPSAYTFNADASGHVTTSGTGAVGFIVYDGNRNIIGFYNTSSFKLPASAGSNYVIKAAAGNGSLAEATKDESIIVNSTDFPLADKWYSLRSKGQTNRYVDSQGAGKGLIGTLQASSSAVNEDTSMHWRFVPRNVSGTEFDIINREDSSYIDPTAEWNTQILTTATQPSAGWKVEPSGDYYYISSGNTQLNQTGSGQSYQIYNWGGGSSTEDNCLFTISDVDDDVDNDDDDPVEIYDLLLAASPADNLSTDQWYVMKNRGSYRGYLYEDESNQLHNTNTEPGLVRSDSKRFLVRLSDAGDGKFYIKTGRGNYVTSLTDNATSTTGDESTQESFTIAKIASTNGHFYVQGSNNVVLDANDFTSGDAAATVVGWGNTAPTSTGGNNDWAFYPVELKDHFAPTMADVYTINNTNEKRGALISYPTASSKWLWSSGKSGSFDADDANCQWIIVSTSNDGEYYLYNVGKQKFAVPTSSGNYGGYSWMFSSDAVPVCLYLQSDGTFKMSSVSGNIYLSVSNTYTGPVISYNDVGAQFTITRQTEASDAVASQLAAALAAKPGANFAQSLNAVGSKSYATLYLDYDAQTDENTKAYYITETNNGYAQLTPVDNDGRNIPAYTAVVLVNENGDTGVTFNAGFSVSRGYGEAVAESTNLLKGTLVSMSLNLSDSTPYYSMGRLNGTIGFYKFNDNGTTTITLGAGKAYLEVPASDVKGYTFDFDEDATAIEMVNGQWSMVNGQSIYNLSGQRLSKPQHGVNIIGGKKVFIK